MKRVTIFYLFKSFLQIGMSSFGGHAALIAMVKDKLSSKDQIISEEVILDTFAITSLLPGPVAVNCIAYIGFYLRGWGGALVSIFAVLLPAILLMILFAHFYQDLQTFNATKGILAGIIPLLIAMISITSWQLFQKQINYFWQMILFGLTLACSIYFQSFYSFLACLIIGALTGYFFGVAEKDKEMEFIATTKPMKIFAMALAWMGLFLLTAYGLNGINLHIFQAFSQISLTLFGGAYVLIPILHDVAVLKNSWISEQVFLEAIALGQITPGPILVSASFIGYYLNGLTGTALATIGIFLPSAILTILINSVFASIKNNQKIKVILQGIRPVSIALITYAIVVLAKTAQFNLFNLGILTGSLLILALTKIHFFWLVIATAFLGFIWQI